MTVGELRRRITPLEFELWKNHMQLQGLMASRNWDAGTAAEYMRVLEQIRDGS